MNTWHKSIIGSVLGSGLIILAALALMGVKEAPPTPLASSVVKVTLANSHGSGVYLGDGYILTAAHVVDAAKEVDIRTDDGKSIKGEVLWANTTYDVALIRVGEITAASSPLQCREPKTGELISAAGNPLAIEFVKFWGHISGKARVVGPWKNAVIMDISGGPGISGGPVFDEAGNVVAIFVGVALAPVGFGASYLGMSVGIPGSTICSLMARA